MDQLKKINTAYRNGLLFDGFYDGEKVKFNKNRHLFNYVMTWAARLFFISHLIIFITNNERLKKELVYLKFSDDFGSKYLNFAGGLLLLSRGFSSTIYSKFTEKPEKFKSFNFLFCFSVEQMRTKFKLSKKRSESQIKDQIKFLRTAQSTLRFLLLTFGSFITKLAYDNLNSSIKFDNQFLDLSIIVIKIIGYLFFSVTLITYLLSSRLCGNESILSCLYLSNRLDDLSDEILELFSDDDKFENRNYMNKKVSKICRQYNSILQTRLEMKKHLDRTLNYVFVLLIFNILYPAIIILDQNKKTALTIFYSTNYSVVLMSLISLFRYNTIFMDSNSRFCKSLTFLARHMNLKQSSQIYNIYILNSDTTLHSFNCRDYFNFTNRFLIMWIIESVNLVFLLNQGIYS